MLSESSLIYETKITIQRHNFIFYFFGKLMVSKLNKTVKTNEFSLFPPQLKYKRLEVCCKKMLISLCCSHEQINYISLLLVNNRSIVPQEEIRFSPVLWKESADKLVTAAFQSLHCSCFLHWRPSITLFFLLLKKLNHKDPIYAASSKQLKLRHDCLNPVKHPCTI